MLILTIVTAQERVDVNHNNSVALAVIQPREVYLFLLFISQADVSALVWTDWRHSSVIRSGFAATFVFRSDI